MTKASFTVASVAVALLLGGTFALMRQNSAAEGTASKRAQVRLARAPGAPAELREPELQRVNRWRPVEPVPVVRGDDVEALAEAALMAELRALGSSDPELSLELAREGNARFPTTAAAPARARIVVKSLVGLGRFHEARDEARRMVAAYPRTPEALDVERHLLVYPLDQPSREQMQADMQGDADTRGNPAQ